jgi:hypothetical protein
VANKIRTGTIPSFERKTMPHDPDKRQLRKLKRVIKRAGSKHRRRDLKRQLAENPDSASEANEDFGRHRSDSFNGLDQDATRKRPEDEDRQKTDFV